ncbi:MAG: sterol-binding protein [Burkholderiales bacterium]|nr:sterol-binding protein [Burkholderiales bacterium]
MPSQTPGGSTAGSPESPAPRSPPERPGLESAAAAAAVNHLLRGAAWARAELARHAGKTARIDTFPASIRLTVREDGTVSPAAAGAAPAVTLALSTGLLLRFAARDESAWREAGMAGDTGFAASIGLLAREINWDFEEDLARVFGDIAGHRMAGAARALRRLGAESGENLARSFVEYWTEERPLIAAARELAAFHREVDDLRDDVARLAKRIERLPGASRAAAPDSGDRNLSGEPHPPRGTRGDAPGTG